MTQPYTQDPTSLLEAASLACQEGNEYYQQYERSKDKAYLDKASEYYNVAFALLCRYAGLPSTDHVSVDNIEHRDSTDG